MGPPIHILVNEKILRIVGCVIAERLSARHLILQHALGRCMYICPSRSSTHARQCVFRHALLRMRASKAGASRADGGWRQTSRSESAYILRAMYGEREDKCDLIISTQCYLLREVYLCALCVYLVDGMKSTGDKTGMVVGAMKCNGG